MLVLIDTWWNVNSYVNDTKESPKNVLIDTWWNVNEEGHKVYYFTPDVLIDTWWNVNLIPFLFVTDCVPCFNRYMVECEYNI